MTGTISLTPPHKDASATREAALYVCIEAERSRGGGLRVGLTGKDVLTVHRAHALSSEAQALNVPDLRLSGAHARFQRELGAWLIEDLGSKNGTWVNGQPHQRTLLNDGDVIQLGHTFFVFRSSEPLPVQGYEKLTLCPQLSRELQRVEAVAKTDVSVRIEGETGSGKERVARWLHERSGRPGAFVAINCGALTDSLVESLLFGHSKGAFSGAVEDSIGFIRSAQEGTLFLDEVGDLSAAAQATLLRVLQEREVTPVGAFKPKPVSFRLVTATHCDLAALVEAKQFRADLFARISGLTVRVPPLRERKGELGFLLVSLLSSDVRMSADACRAIMNYDWPLNVRELQKALEVASALAMARDGVIRTSDLPDIVHQQAVVPPSNPARRTELINLLQRHHGNVSAVAKEVGKARMQIQRWMKQFKIDPAAFRKTG